MPALIAVFFFVIGLERLGRLNDAGRGTGRASAMAVLPRITEAVRAMSDLLSTGLLHSGVPLARR